MYNPCRWAHSFAFQDQSSSLQQWSIDTIEKVRGTGVIHFEGDQTIQNIKCMAGWWLKKKNHADPWGNDPILLILFQIGWFNHHLDGDFDGFPIYIIVQSLGW